MMSRRFTVKSIIACGLLICLEGVAASRETDALVLEEIKGLTSITGNLQGTVIGFEEQLEMVAEACVNYPQLKQEVDRLVDDVKSQAGNQKQKFLDLFAEAACNKARDCALAAQMKEQAARSDAQDQRIRDIENALAENSPSQVLPSPAPSYGEVVPAPELPSRPIPSAQPRIWIGPVHYLIARPASGLVMFNQPVVFVYKCVDVPWSNGLRTHGDMHQLSNGQCVLVTHLPRIAHQSALAVR